MNIIDKNPASTIEQPKVPQRLPKVISLKELVLDHTQFKFYAAFLPPDKRKEALNYAVSNNKCFGRKIPVPAQKPITYLKYCPICVKEEREKYGECYFHVEQNIPYVDVCHQHKCKLINTSVINVKSNNEMFWPLDLLVNSFKDINSIYIVACGSAYHVGVCEQYVIESLARVPVRVDVASEFRYKKPLYQFHRAGA